MKKIEIINPYQGFEKAIGLNGLVVEKVKIIHFAKKELMVQVKVLGTAKCGDLIKLNEIITNKLEEFKNIFYITYNLSFEKENDKIKVISFLIEKFILEKSYINVNFDEIQILENLHTVYINSTNELVNENFKKSSLNKFLSKYLEEIYDTKIDVEFSFIPIENNNKVKTKKVKVEEEFEKIAIKELVENKFIKSSGEIFDIAIKEINTKRGPMNIFSFYITDNKTSVICKKFYSASDKVEFKVGDIVNFSGNYQKDPYTNEYVINLKTITKTGHNDHLIIDDAKVKRVELNLKTNMSELYSNIDCEKISAKLKDMGYSSFAVADLGVVHSFPFLYNKAPKDMKVIFGMDAFVVDDYEELVVNPKPIVLEEETYVIFDIETTGFDPYNDKIIEIGAVKMKNFEIVDKYSKFIDPKIPIPEIIKELTHISDEDVKGQETIDKVLPDFLEFIKNTTLVAQNAKFDVGFITEKAKQLGIKTSFSYIDTITWAKLLLKDQKKFNLDALCKVFSIPNKNHHRAINDAEVTYEIFKIFLSRVSALNVNTLEEVNEKLHLDVKIASTNTTTILVKNKKGLRVLYELVSESLIENFGNSLPRIKKSKLDANRENLLLSSSANYEFKNSGELISLYIRGIDSEEIEEASKFYDYFQILPSNYYEPLIKAGEISDKKVIEDMNKYFIELANKQNKKVVAVGNVMYLTKEEKEVKAVLKVAKEGFKNSKGLTNAYFRTTNEMLEDFNYLGSDLSYEVVVTNTNYIADQIEQFEPIPKGFYPPKIDGAEEMVKELTFKKAYELYGENIPTKIKERIDLELNAIIDNGFAVLYLIAQKLVHKSVENGYMVGSRGSVGSSLVAYLIGITEVNGFSPHYRCPKCKNVEIVDSSISGVDLPYKECENCKIAYIRDGHAIPFEVFMGFNGNKVPDIDLNFSGEYQSEIHKYTEELFGKENVFRAGTIATTAEKNAIGYVRKYFEEKLKDSINEELNSQLSSKNEFRGKDDLRKEFLNIEFSKNAAEIKRLAKAIEGTRKTTGQHPGGMVVVPRDKSIYDFTPIQKPANDLTSESTTTHFDYHVMDSQLVKLDILGHDDPTTLKILEDLTKLSPYEIPLNDEKVLSIFTSSKALGIDNDEEMFSLGTNGIPEFGTNFVKEMLKDTKPTTFTELVRISGLSHGTNVWLNNAKDYVNSNVASLSEVITVRDDIMNYLTLQGMEKKTAFEIMEFIRKGKPSKDKETWEMYKTKMREVGAKEWYIDSCEKIQYMFPKGHAVAYVMMAMRIAYFKVYYPLEFYTAYLNRKVTSFTYSKMFDTLDNLKKRLNNLQALAKKSVNDKAEINLYEILIEMSYRGIELLPVDLYKSEAKTFVINDNKIRIPFIGIDQLGDVIANNIVNERKKEKFTSQENLLKRTGLNNTVFSLLKNFKILEGLSETDQQTLF